MRGLRFGAIAGGVAAATWLFAACDFGGVDDGVTRPGTGGGGNDAMVLGDAPLGESVCARAGGTAGMSAIASEAVTRLSADCRIGASFTALSAGQRGHMIDCFANFLGATIGCPGVAYEGSKDKGGQACRALGTAHQGLNLSGDDYRAFSESVIGALRDTGHLIPGEIGSVMAKFNAQGGIYSQQLAGFGKCTCGPGGACTPPKPDSGPPDTGPPDTGTPDTGTPDTGTPDTGTTDSGATDGGAD